MPRRRERGRWSNNDEENSDIDDLVRVERENDRGFERERDLKDLGIETRNEDEDQNEEEEGSGEKPPTIVLFEPDDPARGPAWRGSGMGTGTGTGRVIEETRIFEREPKARRSVSISTHDEDDTLHRIASSGTVTQAQTLIAQGSKLGATDSHGQTPLHTACASGSSDMIAFLLQQYPQGKDIKDYRGNTPLHIICLGRRGDTDGRLMEKGIRLLVDAGVNVNARRFLEDGCAALHLLSSKNGSGSGSGTGLDLGASIRIMRLLLSNGADCSLKDNNGKTPLHRAVISGREEVVELLLQFNASVDAVDEQGHTPLHLCLVSEDLGILNLLLRFGADVNPKSRRGLTMLHQVCRFKWEGAVVPLLRAGADMSVKTRDGLTAEELAEKSGASGIVATLHEWHAKQNPEKGLEERAATVPVSVPISAPPPPPPPEKETSKDHVWAGVRRDNGDGFVLAKYTKHDISFDAKLESIYPTIHEGKDMHEIQMKLNFMRPYSMDHRIRYANVDVMLSGASAGPRIRGIMPQADRMEVSEQEITSGKTFTVGAAGSGGPSNVNISLEGSKSQRATFKGVRIIHGAIRDKTHASWRLYEEPGSRSGLPEICRLLLLVHAEEEFEIRLALSVKACHSMTLGIPRTLSAPSGLVYTVPKLNIIASYEQESRLHQILNVADRAATVVEDAKQMEDMFSRAMREHKKRNLIMEAGSIERHLQEWAGILDDSKSNDFWTLQQKLVGLEQQIQVERDQEEILEMIDAPIRVDEESSDAAERRRTRTRTRTRYRDPEILPHRRLRESRWETKLEPELRMPRTRDYVEMSPRRGYEDDELYGERNRRQPKKLESFSAVGPGYHVSRLA